MQKLVAGNTELELSKSVSIPLIFKVSDIKDISKRSAPFSKTLKLPGTEINNKFFGGLYDFNADFTIFNPNLKTPCIFSNDGNEFINGFLQLKQVIRNDKKDITYDVVLYDSVVTFWSKLDKQKLGDLDYSDLDHVFTRANIVASWAGAWNTIGYYYAMHYGTSQIVKTTDFRPAIYEKVLLDKIITAAGFTWSGNLKNNPIFEREIIQSEVERPTISAAEAASKAFRAEKSIDELIYTNNTNATAITPITFPLKFDDEVTPPNDDTNNLWDAVNKFTAPKIGKYRFNYDSVKVRVDYEFDVAVGNQLNGYAKVSVRLTTVIKDNLANVIDTIQGSFNLGQQNLGSTSGIGRSGTSISTPVTGLLYSNNSNDIYLGVGWTIETFVEVRGSTVVKDFFNNTLTTFTMNEIRVDIVAGGSFESQNIVYAYEDNVPLIFKDFMSIEFLQKDVIKDLMVRYNCYVYVNPENSNDIVFNIRDEFYATAPVVDWTDKKDYNTRDQIKLVAELQSEELLLSYSKGDDATNKNYTDLIGDKNIFGQFEYEFGNEFVKGKQKITSPYNPTPLVVHGAINAIVPAIPMRQPIIGMRVLYAGGVIAIGFINWTFQYRTAQGVLTNAAHTGYPYAGHLDDPNTPTIDINFGELPFPQLYYQGLVQTTNNNLFNRYWRNTINQQADGRLVISKFNLTAADVYFVKNNPNTRVFADNKYYYINKIPFEANEDLRKLTKVELITVEDDIFVDIQASKVPGQGDSGNVFTPDPLGGGAPGNDLPGDNPSLEVSGTNNTLGENTQRIIVNGDGNFVDANQEDVFIQGDNNRVFGSGVTLIGVDNLTVRQDNISIINGVITKGCMTGVFFNKIDGGLDTLSRETRTCKLNKINGELDGNFDLFNVSLFNKIDSENGITEEI